MKWIEKIKAMDVDELAEFIVQCSEYDGVADKACKKCPYYKGDGECTSEFLSRDCKNAVKNLLESEVEENADS